MTDTIASPTETEEEKRGKRHLSALLLRAGQALSTDSLDIHHRRSSTAQRNDDVIAIAFAIAETIITTLY